MNRVPEGSDAGPSFAVSLRRAAAGLATGVFALLLAACGQAPSPDSAAVAGAPSEKAQLASAASAVAPASGVIEKAATVAPVFRFAKISNGAYFFTGNVGEKDLILAQYPDFRCEGLAFFRSTEAAGAVPVYRFANLGNGGYFYTASQAERDFVQATRPDMRYEGSTFSVVPADTPGAQPVFRLANLRNGAYLFTTSAAERDFAVGLGFWRSEGTAFHGAPPDAAQVGAAYCTPPGGPPTVSGISVDTLFYLGTSTFTVSGTNLGDDIGLASSGCSGMTAVPGGSATSRSFRCSPSTTGNVLFRVVRGDNTIYSAAGEIPIPRVRISTNLGDIVVQLDPAKAPVTVANFLQYVRDGFYDGLIFHRVISTFMIQGGGFDLSLQQKATRAPIALESNNGLSNLRGTIAMARTSAPNSATSQFFINVVDNLFLNFSATNAGYAVFGSVVQGLDVVDQIKVVPTSTISGMQDVPTTPVVISRITQIQ